jgi:hypothetical protein
VEQGAEEQIIRGTTWDDNKEREQREMSDIAAEMEMEMGLQGRRDEASFSAFCDFVLCYLP